LASDVTAPQGMIAPPALVPPAADEDELARLRLQSAALEAASTSVFITDADGNILWVNQAFSRLTGYSREEAVGRRPSLLKSGHQSEDWYRNFWRVIRSGQVWRGRNTNRRRDGSLFDVEQTVTPVVDPAGRITHFISIHEDITERLRAEQEIRRLALSDAITGLPNRVAFQQRVEQALHRSRRNRKPLAVLLLDLDHFKNVNDTLGHAAGDNLLAQVAKRIDGELRESDLAARLGGDEFAVLLEELDSPMRAGEAAQRLLVAIAAPYDVTGHSAHVSASIGIAVNGASTESAEGLLKNADLAMYAAKAAGRNRFHYFDADLDADARRRFATEAALREALSGDGLELVYQPLYRLQDFSLTGVEALLRWHHPRHGDIPPAEIVRLAEHSGLMQPLNEWVLDQALRQAGEWKKQGSQPFRLAVNVSAGQFAHGGLVPRIEALLLEHHLRGEDLELEITETLIMPGNLAVQGNVQRLRQLGIRLAVDDFGTGYSSLLSLRDYPVSRLKIDASFVHGIGRKGKDEQIIRALIGLAQHLDLQVVAEGVETGQQEEFLRREGCGELQGFRYARPMSADAIGALLSRRRH
jgi:diguanylate cyclase (GGDEF)-like protein/PAS domain S-box-containing protein